MQLRETKDTYWRILTVFEGFISAVNSAYIFRIETFEAWTHLALSDQYPFILPTQSDSTIIPIISMLKMVKVCSSETFGNTIRFNTAPSAKNGTDIAMRAHKSATDDLQNPHLRVLLIMSHKYAHVDLCMLLRTPEFASQPWWVYWEWSPSTLRSIVCHTLCTQLYGSKVLS